MVRFVAVIPKVNVKVFYKAFHCLAKIGHDVVFETTEDRLLLRVLAQSEAAFGHFAFSASFFESFKYEPEEGDHRQGQEQEFFKCKVNSKSVLTAFRALQTIDKLVFELEGKHNLLVLKLHHSRTGIKRTYQFAFQEQTNILQADFNRNACPNVLVANAKFFNRYLSNFQGSEGEITLVLTDLGLKVSNLVDEQGAGGELDTQMHTQFLLTPQDFERFEVAPRCYNSDITFCLRELKAMGIFCEQGDFNLHIYCFGGGQPVLLSTSAEASSTFCADIVVATLQNEDEEEAEPDQSQPYAYTPHPAAHNSQPQVHSQSQASSQGSGPHSALSQHQSSSQHQQSSSQHQQSSSQHQPSSQQQPQRPPQRQSQMHSQQRQHRPQHQQQYQQQQRQTPQPQHNTQNSYRNSSGSQASPYQPRTGPSQGSGPHTLNASTSSSSSSSSSQCTTSTDISFDVPHPGDGHNLDGQFGTPSHASVRSCVSTSSHGPGPSLATSAPPWTPNHTGSVSHVSATMSYGSRPVPATPTFVSSAPGAGGANPSPVAPAADDEDDYVMGTPQPPSYFNKRQRQI